MLIYRMRWDELDQDAARLRVPGTFTEEPWSVGVLQQTYVG
jgi:hypothetical protein